MLPDFCLRLALGMLACLLLLAPIASAGPRPLVSPRFYRTHFLTALALICLALLFAHDHADRPLLTALGAALALAFAGSISWSLEGSPGGPALIVLAIGALLVALGLRGTMRAEALAGRVTSAALLGAAL